MLELKLKQEASEENESRIVMIRYVSFCQFSQAEYPLVYLTIVRSVIEEALLYPPLVLENKLSSFEVDEMMSEEEIGEMDSLYQRVLLKNTSFPEVARKFNRFVNETLPLS